MKPVSFARFTAVGVAAAAFFSATPVLAQVADCVVVRDATLGDFRSVYSVECGYDVEVSEFEIVDNDYRPQENFEDTATVAVGDTVRSAGSGNVTIGSSAISGRLTFTDPLVSGDTTFYRHRVAPASYTVVIGSLANAQADYGMALGSRAFAASAAGMAVGGGATSEGIGAMAIGPDTHARGDHTIALGPEAQSLAVQSVSIGYRSLAASEASIAIGAEASTDAAGEIAIGRGAQALAKGAIAIGSNAIADSSYTVSFGNAGDTRRLTHLSAGIAPSDAATVGQLDAAILESTTELVYLAIDSAGLAAVASGVDALALGAQAKAEGSATIAMGRQASAQGDASIAIGGDSALDVDEDGASAAGAYAIAMGSDTAADGTASVAIGPFAEATANRAFALGAGAVASGRGSYAIGINATASQANAIAFGPRANAAHLNAIAFGFEAMTTRDNQIMLGSTTYTYTMPGIFSSASNAAQSGTIYAVTIDSNGNLGYTSLSTGGVTMSAASSAGMTSIAPNAAAGTLVSNRAGIEMAQAGGSVAPVEAAPAEPVAVATLDEAHDVAEPAPASYRDRAGERLANGTGSNAGAAALAADTFGNGPIAAVTDAQFSALSNRVGVLEGRVDAIEFQLSDMDRTFRQGIALATATASPHFPTGTGRTSYASNVAYYRGEIGVAAGVMHRFDGDFAVTFGATYGGGDHAAVRAGVAGEF